MEITGKIISMGKIAHGRTKANKTWSKVELVIETEEKYPKLVALTAWGETAHNIYSADLYHRITAKIELVSTEAPDKRWYTNVNLLNFTNHSK